MVINFKHIEPHDLLKPYLDKMWVFESSGKLPSDDFKLVVPNGNIKLTIFSRNGITASFNNKKVTSPEGTINLTGIVDIPLHIDTEKDIPTQSIGIEFNPKGAYRFFKINLSDVRNQIYQLDDVLGHVGKQVEEQVANAISLREKIDIVQQFLIRRLLQNSGDLIFEFCVDKITSSKGKITVKELEKKTGYSSRWLNIKFTDKIGVSPKNLSSIIRFSQYYQSFLHGSEQQFLENEFYHYYYDQSHFLRAFKRFTGLTPTRFESNQNEFSRQFHRD